MHQLGVQCTRAVRDKGDRLFQGIDAAEHNRDKDGALAGAPTGPTHGRTSNSTTGHQLCYFLDNFFNYRFNQRPCPPRSSS